MLPPTRREHRRCRTTITSASRWRTRRRAPSSRSTAAPATALQPLPAPVLRLQHGRGAAPGRIVDEAVRARDGDQPGHGRAGQRAERLLAALDPAGLDRGRTGPSCPRRSPRPWVPPAAKSTGWWESVGDASMGAISVAVAAAQSSDPAFTDLTHRVGVQNIINTAAAFGVGADPFNLGTNDLQGLNGLFGTKGSISGIGPDRARPGRPDADRAGVDVRHPDRRRRLPRAARDQQAVGVDTERSAVGPAPGRQPRRHEPGRCSGRGLRPVVRQHQRHRLPERDLAGPHGDRQDGHPG